MSDSEKPTFLGLEGMLQDLGGANSIKANSVPPPASAPEVQGQGDDDGGARRGTARETPAAKSPRPPPLPIIAYGTRTSPVPPNVDGPPSSGAAPTGRGDRPPPSSSSALTQRVDRGDPVAALEPDTDLDAAVEPAPRTELSPATQPVSAADLEPEGPKSELAKTRVSAAVVLAEGTGADSKPSSSKPASAIPVELVAEKSEPVKSEPAKSEPEKKPVVLSARAALEGKPEKEKKKDPANARFPTLKALDEGEEKSKSGMWIALGVLLIGGGLGWYFLKDRLQSGGTTPTAATATATAPASAAATAPASASASAAATVTASASVAASVAASASAPASASVAAPASAAPTTTTAATGRPPAGTGGTHGTATSHATAPPPPTTATATAPPPPTTATATAPPPPTSTKPSLINEP